MPRPLMAGSIALLSLIVIAGWLPLGGRSKAQTPRTSSNTRIAATNPQNGKLVFERQGCDKCHGSQGEGTALPGASVRMPPIGSTGLALPTFIQLIRKPKGQMPPYNGSQVSDRELSDVYDFLHASPRPPAHEAALAANPENGQRLFAKYGCYACHLSHGQGSRVTGVRLGPPAIPLSAFISYVRKPTGDMPPYTQKTLSNEELADMYAFLRSVPQSPSWTTIPLLNQ